MCCSLHFIYTKLPTEIEWQTMVEQDNRFTVLHELRFFSLFSVNFFLYRVDHVSCTTIQTSKQWIFPRVYAENIYFRDFVLFLSTQTKNW